MAALTFLARWPVRPDKRAEFTALVNELAGEIPQAAYDANLYINIGWNRHGEFLASESWGDEDAINALRASPVFHDIMRRMTACCDRPLQLEIVDGFDGDGSIFARYAAGIADPRYYPDLGPLTARVA